MPQETVSTMSANNLQTYCLCISQLATPHLYIIAQIFPQCKTSRPNMKATGTQGPCLSVLHKDRSQCISQENQADFEQILKLLMSLLISLMVNIFS